MRNNGLPGLKFIATAAHNPKLGRPKPAPDIQMEASKRSPPVRDIKEESRESGPNILPPLPPSLLVNVKSQVSKQVLEEFMPPDEGKEKMKMESLPEGFNYNPYLPMSKEVVSFENQQLARQKKFKYQRQQQQQMAIEQLKRKKQSASRQHSRTVTSVAIKPTMTQLKMPPVIGHEAHHGSPENAAKSSSDILSLKQSSPSGKPLSRRFPKQFATDKQERLLNFDSISLPQPRKVNDVGLYPDLQPRTHIRSESSLPVAFEDTPLLEEYMLHQPTMDKPRRKRTPLLTLSKASKDTPLLEKYMWHQPTKDKRHLKHNTLPKGRLLTKGQRKERGLLRVKEVLAFDHQHLPQTTLSTDPKDDYYLSICEQVMREYGSMDQTIMHCIFVGPAGVGKSSLLKRLLRMKLDPKRTSTQIAEQSVRLEIIRDVSTTAAQVSGLDWQKIQDLNSQACGLLGQISTKQEKAMSKHTTSKSPDSELPQHSQFSKTIDFFRKVLKEKGVSGLRQHVSPWTLYLTDSGGQPEFQELLPALVVGPCVFFVVVPLDKDLRRKYIVEYLRPDEQKCMRNYLSSLTVQEDLLRSLASIASIKYKDKDGNDVKPRIMLVATFKDKISQEDCQRRLKEIQDIVEETDAFRQGMIVDASETQMVFTINNVSDDESEKDAKEIRDAFQVIADGFKVHTPSPWLIFSILVQYVHAKEAVVGKDKCFEIAQECGIRNETEFEAALQFLYKQTGMLRYYKEPSELSQIVIKDPQHLFSRVTHLVEKTFTFKETRSRRCTNNFKKGIFSKTDYEALTKDSSSSKLTPSMLLKLLEHLHVVVPLGDGEKYFMPCAIAHLKDTSISHTQSATIPPLLITFKTGYCPQGLFGVFVACIANKQVANCTLDLDESQIRRNQICFTMGLYRLLLRITPTYIYIEVIPNSANFSLSPELCTLCNSVRELLEGNITEACKTLCYSDNANCGLSFMCQCDQHGQLHPAHLRNDPVQRHIFLCSQSKKDVTINPECHVWLPEPTILLHPENQSVAAGTEAVLRVTATGDKLRFQWQRDRSDLCDGGRYCDTKTDTLHIVDVEEGDKGRYRCIVKNDIERKPSNEALLTIIKSLPPPGALPGMLQPSGAGIILSGQDLHTLTEIMRPAAPQWRTIGGSLGIPDSDLNIIQHTLILLPEGPLGYFREMLSQWLKWAPPNHPWPTLEALAAALQINGQEGLAVNLKSVFQQSKGVWTMACNQPTMYATPHQTPQLPCVQMQTQDKPFYQPQFTYYPRPQQQGQEGYSMAVSMPQQNIGMPTPLLTQPAVHQQMPPEIHTYQGRPQFHPQPVVQIPTQQTQPTRKPFLFPAAEYATNATAICRSSTRRRPTPPSASSSSNKLQPKPQAQQLAPLPQSLTSSTTPAVVSSQFSQPDSANVKLDRRKSL